MFNVHKHLLWTINQFQCACGQQPCSQQLRMQQPPVQKKSPVRQCVHYIIHPCVQYQSPAKQWNSVILAKWASTTVNIKAIVSLKSWFWSWTYAQSNQLLPKRSNFCTIAHVRLIFRLQQGVRHHVLKYINQCVRTRFREVVLLVDSKRTVISAN